MYILDDVVNKHSNTYHSTIKMKPVKVKSCTYIVFGPENNKKDTKFKVSDHVRISKRENIFAKVYVPNWGEGVFVIKKVKNNVLWMYVLVVLKLEEFLERFKKSNGKKQIKKS